MAKTIASSSKPGAWIVNPNDKGRKSIKNGKVFLENNSYFEIELFNPLTVSVLADIKLNGQSISKTGLIVKPGQRVYLDCFIDDKKKFIFKTYEIDYSQESLDAIQNNGLLEVFFYKEDVITLDNWKSKFDRIIVEKYYPYNPYPWQNPYTVWYVKNPSNFCGISTANGSLTNGSITIGTSLFSNTINSSYSTSVDLSSLTTNNTINTSIETGRVEKGGKSKQQFTEVDMDFEKHYIASTIIQILPESRKPAEVNVKIKSKDILKKESDEVLELIKKLSELHSAGILEDEEFQDKKNELLKRI